MPDLSVLIRQLQGLVFNTLLMLAVAGRRRIAFGSGTLTYAASSISNTTTVTHGLTDDDGNAVVPVVVLAMQGYDGDGRHAAVGAFNVGATTFDVTARDWAGAGISKTSVFWWVAIG